MAQPHVAARWPSPARLPAIEGRQEASARPHRSKDQASQVAPGRRLFSFFFLSFFFFLFISSK
jgi:hypothetical protein